MHFNLDITTITKSACGRAECENPGQSPKEIKQKATAGSLSSMCLQDLLSD